jgi:4-hydroxy-L-threonine phosphate dehydrogenase PdxA
MLSFERYCGPDDDISTIKAEIEKVKTTLRGAIAKTIQIEIICACEVTGFNDHSGEVGYFGPRSRNFTNSLAD